MNNIHRNGRGPACRVLRPSFSAYRIARPFATSSIATAGPRIGAISKVSRPATGRTVFDDHGFFGGNAWAFCDYVIPVLKKIDRSIHAITNTIIDIEGDRAFCESQWSVVHRLREDDGLLDYWHQGRYIDIFEKRDGEWRIFLRTIASDTDRLLKTKDIRQIMAAAAAQSPPTGRGAENAALAGARAPQDPVYFGFGIADVVKERPGMPDLWGPYHALAKIL